MLTADERLLWIYTFLKFKDKPILLDFWQDCFVKSNSRFIAVVKSRQVGYSFISAMKSFAKLMDPARKGYTCQYVSYNESDAEEKILYAKQFYDSLDPNVRKKCIVSNRSEMQFLDADGKSISRLISMPCRPPRGKNGDINLDEFGIYLPQMSEAIYTAALPVISRGGCITIGSSPLGSVGRFYEVITDVSTYESYQRFSIAWWLCRDLCKDTSLALKSGIVDMATRDRVDIWGTEIIQNIYHSMPEDKFQQEYECLFLDDAESYIPLSLIHANTPGHQDSTHLIELEQSEISDDEYWNYNRQVDFMTYNNPDDAILNYNPDIHGGPLFLGYDVAKNRDAVCFYVLGRLNGKKRSFARITKKGISFEAQKDIFRQLMRRLPIHRACMDSTGMGSPLYEELHKEFGDRVEGVDFTLVSKEEMAIAVKCGLENQNFLLENDKDFHRVMHSIQRYASTGGHFRYDSPRNSKGHADEFWAFALADRAERRTAQGNEDFYAQYTRKKNSSVIKLNTDLVQPTGESIIIPRGKSLNSVMRSIRHGNGN